MTTTNIQPIWATFFVHPTHVTALDGIDIDFTLPHPGEHLKPGHVTPRSLRIELNEHIALADIKQAFEKFITTLCTEHCDNLPQLTDTLLDDHLHINYHDEQQMVRFINQLNNQSLIVFTPALEQHLKQLTPSPYLAPTPHPGGDT